MKSLLDIPTGLHFKPQRLPDCLPKTASNLKKKLWFELGLLDILRGKNLKPSRMPSTLKSIKFRKIWFNAVNTIGLSGFKTPHLWIHER